MYFFGFSFLSVHFRFDVVPLVNLYVLVSLQQKIKKKYALTYVYLLDHVTLFTREWRKNGCHEVNSFVIKSNASLQDLAQVWMIMIKPLEKWENGETRSSRFRSKSTFSYSRSPLIAIFRYSSVSRTQLSFKIFIKSRYTYLRITRDELSFSKIS